MAKKRKSGNQQFKVVVGIVIIVCALLVAYGPLKEAWQQYGNDTFKEWASDITRSTAAQEKPATAQPSAETAQAPATKSDKSATTPSKPTTQSKPATAQNKAGTTPAPQPTAKAGSTPQKQKITVNPLLPAPLKNKAVAVAAACLLAAGSVFGVGGAKLAAYESSTAAAFELPPPIPAATGICLTIRNRHEGFTPAVRA